MEEVVLSPKCLVLRVLVEFGAQYLCGLEREIRQNSRSGVIASLTRAGGNAGKRSEKRIRRALVYEMAG